MSARQRSSNYLESSKGNVGEFDAVTLTMLYLNVLMIWSHKILKSIFQMYQSCPRNMFTELDKKIT